MTQRTNVEHEVAVALPSTFVRLDRLRCKKDFEPKKKWPGLAVMTA